MSAARKGHARARQELELASLLHPEIAAALTLAQTFLTMVREKDVDVLPAWLASAFSSSVPELRTFARGIERDRAAVEAALSRNVKQWANGRPDYEAETHQMLYVRPR
jgi:transposase